MSESELDHIRQILGRAKVILEEFAMPRNGLDPTTRSLISQIGSHLESFQNSSELEQAAENVRYQNLLAKLAAEDKKISRNVYDGSKRFLE